MTAERGRLLDAPAGPAVRLTVPPSAALRLRGKPGWDAAFEVFRADLRIAASAIE